MRKRNHPDYYYAIRDAVIALLGPQFDQDEFQKYFPKAAVPHKVIPFSDGYLAHRRIIEGLAKVRMERTSRLLPKVQLRLQV